MTNIQRIHAGTRGTHQGAGATRPRGRRARLAAVAVLALGAAGCAGGLSTAIPTPTMQGGASVCGLDAVALDGELTAAPAVEWVTHGQVDYPSSDTFGPGAIAEEGYPYCYARTPEGAVLTAAAYMSMNTSPDVFSPYLEYVLVENADKAGSTDITPAGYGPSELVEVVGFRLESYDGSDAELDIAVRYTNRGSEQYMSLDYSLEWIDGDWRIVPLGNTGDAGNVSSLASLAGFTLW